MKQPNEYWLKYMLTFSGLRRDQIIEAAELYSMVPPTRDYLSELNRKLEETKPSPFRVNSASVLAWIRRQRFLSLYREDEAAIKARDLLGDEKKRDIIEALTLAETPVDKIADYIELLCNKAIDVKVVKLFQHYFWNPKIMSTTKWYDYLDTHPRGYTLKSCLNKGEEFSLWKLGYRVSISQEDMLRTVFHESSMRFLELNGKANNRHTALTAKLWAENIFKANEELIRTGDTTKEVLEELRSIAIRLGKREISSVEDLKTDE